MNEKAEAKYNDIVENRKSLIMERGLRPNETLNRDGGIAEFIISRGWETLTVVPMTAVVPVVREFYADAFFEQDNNLVIVRGTMVSFSANTINEYYGLETSVNDEYVEYLTEYLDYNAIIS